MECGGDWKHLAPLRYVQMNDGMGVYSCGLGREVWEGETLFAAIALALWEVEVCSPPCVLFLWVNLCLFVYLSLVHCLPPLLLVCFFLTFCLLFSSHFPLIHQLPLCLYLSS